MNNNTIEKLTEEIKEIIYQIDLKISELDDVNKNITILEENNNELKEELDNNTFILQNTIEWKYLRWVFLVSLITSCVAFTFLSFTSVNEVGFLVKIILSVIASYPLFVIGYSSYKTFERQIQVYCIKKYPEIRKIFDKVNSIKNSIILNDKKLTKLRKNGDALLLEIDNNRYILDSKKLDLAQFEENCIKENTNCLDFSFDNIESQNKIRVRVP